MPQQKPSLSSDEVLKQLYGHIEELSNLTDRLTQLLSSTETQVTSETVRDLADRLAKTTWATLLLAHALQGQL